MPASYLNSPPELLNNVSTKKNATTKINPNKTQDIWKKRTTKKSSKPCYGENLETNL